MTCLILDTSTDLCLIGIAKENCIVSQEIYVHSNLLSKNFIPSVQAMLQRNGLHPSHLTSIAIGIGPGSYTGTRLGVAVARSLAFGLNIPIRAFGSPLAFLPERAGAFAFIIPARSGDYFLLKGDIGDPLKTHAGLIPANALASSAEEASFLIFPSSHSIPDFLKEKPCFAPVPNLHVLCRFLLFLQDSDPENIGLHYLHTPF